MGTFSKASRPVLAGSYFDFVAQQPPVVLPSAGTVVALGFTHTWGPANQAVALDSFADFLSTYQADSNNPTTGYIAVKQAFQGSGVGGEGGAGRVLAYRMVGAAGAKATKTLQNTAGTPANAITLSAKYAGTFANGLRVTTQDYAADATKNQLLLLDSNGNVLETYTYTDTDITGLVSQINAGSDYVTATMLVTGVSLGVVASQALTGGNDGTTLIASDYTAAMAALETQRFGVLVFENLTDSTITASLKTWVQGQNAAGRRFFLVVGGALDEGIGTAITRGLTLNDPEILNFGVGRIIDNNLLDINDNPIVLSPAQFAPRVAGVLAQRNERMSLTFTKIDGIDIQNGASAADIVKAYDNGIIVLSRSSDANATVRIEKGLTSFTTTTDSSRPRAVFSNPKFVATMHGLQTDLTEWANENIIGQTTVDDETRHAVLAQAITQLTARQAVGSVQNGWTAVVDPTPAPSNDDNFVAVLLGARFGRSTEQVFWTATVG